MLNYLEFLKKFQENITCGHYVTLQHIKQDNDKKLELNTCNKTLTTIMPILTNPNSHQARSNKTLTAIRPIPTRP